MTTHIRQSIIAISMLALVLGITAPQAQAAHSIQTTQMPDAIKGQAYSFQFQATGGSGPYKFQKWYLTYPGSEMTLSESGVFSGTPNGTASTYELGIRVEDANGLGVYGVFPWKINANTGGGTNSAPVLTAIQGYNPTGNPQYTDNQATSGTFVILYGSFAAIGNQLVSSGNVSGTIYSQSANQINIQLPVNSTGTATFAVSNSNGTTSAKSIAVVTAAGGGNNLSTLTVSNDSTLVTGPIPTGTVNYIFAAFNLKAGAAPVGITSLRIVSDSSSSSEFRNIVLYKDRSEFIGGNATSLNATSGNNKYATFTFSPTLTIPANATVLIEARASITDQASGQVRLGVDTFQFSGTAPTVTPALPFYGNQVQVGTSGGGGNTSATLTATVTPAACTATTAQVALSVQGVGGTTYIVQRNNSNYITFIGGGSVTDSISIGTTNTYTLLSNGQQIGTPKSVTGVKQTSCGGTTAPTVTISRDGTLPTALNVTPGQKNVTLFDAKVSSTGGDILVYSLSVGGSTATDLDKLENERIQYDSTTVQGAGGGSNATGSTAATYTFPQPITITNGNSKTFRFLADITTTATGTTTPKITGYSIKTIAGQDITNATISGTVGTTLTIGNGTTPGTLAITSPDQLPDGTVGQLYSYTLAASGGTAPYSWSLPSGQYNLYPCCHVQLKPTGIFASLETTGSGYMPFAGNYELPVKITDAAGATVQKTLKYTIKTASTPNPTTKVAEGYIDNLSATTVSGWAYTNQPTSGQTPTVTIQYENIANQNQVFTQTLQPSQVRADVASYLEKKYSLPAITAATAFSGNPSSSITTNGTYRIKTAQFDGNTFVLSEAAKKSFTIGAPSAGPIGKYVKVEGDPTVYWVTSWGGKMPILTAAVFASYGGRFEDIVIISQEVLDDYDDVEYIKLQGNARVYKIEGAIKRYLTPSAATRLQVDPAKVVTVNATEFYSYRTGKTLQ